MSYCDWSKGNELLELYHQTEWGIPIKEDIKHFEHLTLESLQSGLSWVLMLKKREIFRACFDNFNYEKIANYDENDVERILNTEGMLRCAGKIRAVINNARRFSEIVSEFGSFSEYIRRFAGDKVIIYDNHPDGLIPTCNGLSDVISKDLKKRGFKYLGSITVYSYLQACGIVNDHGKNCPCFERINQAFPTVQKECDNERGVMQYT